MKNMLLKQPGRPGRHRGLHYHCSEFLMDAECGLYVEDYLHEIIHLERKRSERSKDPFLLLLIDIGPIAAEKDANETIRTISGALSELTRETDIKGWYRCNQVIGVVLTEIKKGDVEAIRRKLYTGLSRPGVLRPDVFERLVITLHLYPEEAPSPQADLKLYPDVLKRESLRKNSLFVKRLVDVAVASAALAILSPILAAGALLIKLTSRGPVFLSQERVGAYGRPFGLLRFRSTYVSGAESGKVTAVGRFLQKTRLDGTAQLLNVLKGDMSIVGPTAPLPREMESYEPWHRRRFIEAKPGITGLRQAKGPKAPELDEMARMDLDYIERWSLALDLMIMLKTPWTAITGRGAKGHA